VKTIAYVPVREYTRYLPEHVQFYATQERALRAGENLWRRGARYLVVVEANLDHPSNQRHFEKYGWEYLSREQVRVIKVRAARP
jgi:hypothetical protein